MGYYDTNRNIMKAFHYLTPCITILSTIVSCDVKDVVQPFVEHSYYIQLQLDNNRVNYEDGLLGMQNTATRTSTNYGTTVLEKQTSFFSGDPNITNNQDIYISQYKILTAPDTIQKEIDSLFTVGDYNYSSTTNKEGIEISVTDGGTTWSSAKGVADQNGSSFKITKHDFLGNNSYRFASYGAFICKLYDGTGKVKLINGSFKLKTNTAIK
jgi:hypothetical protein